LCMFVYDALGNSKLHSAALQLRCRTILIAHILVNTASTAVSQSLYRTEYL